MSDQGKCDDVLMREWESLQTGIRDYKSQYHRRIITGTTALALVAGYAFLANVELLLIFIPIIIGLVFIIHVQETNNVYFRQWQCYRIEDELSVDVDWTHKFSGLARSNEFHQISSMKKFLGYPRPYVATGAAILTGLLVYMGFAIYSIFVVLPTITPVSNVIVWVGGAVGYLLWLVLLVIVGKSHHDIRKEFEENELG